MPFDVTDYVHRIGRTGRAGRPGMALTLVTPSERHRCGPSKLFTRQPLARATLPSPAWKTSAIHVSSAVSSAILAESNLHRELVLVQELATGTDADVARIAAAAIQLARAPEQRPLAAVRDLPNLPTRTTASPDRRTSRETVRPTWRPPPSSTVQRSSGVLLRDEAVSRPCWALSRRREREEKIGVKSLGRC